MTPSPTAGRPIFPSMRAALSLAVLAVALGGCSLGDCAFETSRAETTDSVLLADGRGVGDTLTVLFVDGLDPVVTLRVAPGVGEAPDVTPDGAVEVLYDARSRGVSGDLAPRPLVSTVRGDTVFVYVDGALDPSVLVPACSLPPASVDVRVRDVLVPPGTVAARVALVRVGDLPAASADALRRSAEARRLARPIHT